MDGRDPWGRRVCVAATVRSKRFLGEVIELDRARAAAIFQNCTNDKRPVMLKNGMQRWTMTKV
ncbi:hypothetical protein X777_13853 [Ooceraea biroi]|uniref:Uncharacterized protein n=1 Tax=Ooceraea biroi TaxID=2015173 RepID=A0A026VZN1_OOCBI|nr:hypothetical protein X777_13853 [Ooceraea biroi]